jgi:pimeloyl-ACP methyl ester carboxylesterase
MAQRLKKRTISQQAVAATTGDADLETTRSGDTEVSGSIKSARDFAAGDPLRERVLVGLPVAERRLRLAGVSTAILEGGAGPPVILLHGPSGYAAHWMRVIPGLVATHRVIVPDLPGHGASVVPDGPFDADRVLNWLGELVERTCESPPVIVAQLLGGAIAARLAGRRNSRLRQLVLVDMLGLRPFQPAPEFGLALGQFLANPNENTHRSLWHHCAFDLESLRERMGGHWKPFEAYNLDRARTPSVRSAVSVLMELFGMPAIQPGVLARIAVPTTLIWGRHDRATPLSVAEEASNRFDWPLHVIDDCADDPPVEQPEALLRVLRAVIED